MEIVNTQFGRLDLEYHLDYGLINCDCADIRHKKGMESLVRLHPFGHWFDVWMLFLIGGKITGSTYSSNDIVVVIAVSFGDDYIFVIEINFVFRYARYLS